MTTSTIETSQPTTWQLAERKCWRHVEIATSMMKLMTKLGNLHVVSVIPIMSDLAPTLLITPEGTGNIQQVKALCRFISVTLELPNDWQRIVISDEWLVRLTVEGIHVDIMTRLPATKESPLDL